MINFSRYYLKGIISIILVLLAGFIVLTPGIVHAEQKEMKVFVSILPQKYFVQAIAGDLVDVDVLVKPGHSPATYEVTTRQMMDLGKSKILFSIGVPFERAWLGKIKKMNPHLKIIKTDNGIPKRAIDKHDHDSDADDHHGGLLDPHIWLDPRLVKLQAETIASAIIKEIPAHKKNIEKNLAAFKKDLDELDIKIRKKLSKVRNRSFMVFHPSWGYFADEYGLVQIAIEKSGKEPSAREMATIIKKAKEEGIHIIFIQQQFSRTTAKAVAKSINGKVVVIDPLSGDYYNNLLKVADEIASAGRNR